MNKVEAVLDRIAPQIAELAEEAIAKAADHVLWVLDSHSTLMQGGECNAVLKAFRDEVKHDVGVVLIPAATAVRLVRTIPAEMLASGDIEKAPRDLERPPPSGAVRILYYIGDTVGFRYARFAPQAPGGDDGETIEDLEARAGVKPFAFTKPDGEPDTAITIPQMFKMFYHCDPTKPEGAWRRAVEGIQRHGAGALAAEEVKASPRDAGDVLFDLFGGEQIHARIDAACRPWEGREVAGPGQVSFLDVILDRIRELDAAGEA